MLEILLTLFLMAPPESEYPEGWVVVPKIGDKYEAGKCPRATWGAICSCIQTDYSTGNCIKEKIIDFDWIKEKDDADSSQTYKR